MWLLFRGKPYTSLKFGTPGPYRLVRHPLYVGWFFAFWMTPTMTYAHLLFAVATAAYAKVCWQRGDEIGIHLAKDQLEVCRPYRPVNYRRR